MSHDFSGCPVDAESPDPCPRCGATVSGDDPVHGVCQAPNLDRVVITDAMVERALAAYREDIVTDCPARRMRRALESALTG